MITRYADRHVHLMGIGGNGMHALVPLLRQLGARVSGCDLADSAITRRLQAAGTSVALGHAPAHLEGVDLLVVSSAIPPEHAEIRAARERGIEVLSRGACLAELAARGRTIAVVGSHGKTTTTWMIGHALRRSGHDPVIVVGGQVAELDDSGSHIGDADTDLSVVELDESDGGFVHVRPTVAVLTNLEAEHARHYGGDEGLRSAIADWLAAVPADGAVVIGPDVDDELLRNVSAPIVRCGRASGPQLLDCTLTGDASSAHLRQGDQDWGRLELHLPGQHNLTNALVALAAARCVEPTAEAQHLAGFQGVARRFNLRGVAGEVRVVDDYAHHPTEIAAAIAAAALAGGNVHAILQPHRYSRVADCFQRFVVSVRGLASCAVLPVYAAGEEPIAGATARALSEAIAADRRAHGGRPETVQYTRSSTAAIAFIVACASARDTVLLLGAGDVGHLAEPVLEALRCV